MTLQQDSIDWSKQGKYVAKSFMAEILYGLYESKSLKVVPKMNDLVGNIVFMNLYDPIMTQIKLILDKIGMGGLFDNYYITDFIIYSIYQVALQLIIRTTGVEMKNDTGLVSLSKESLKFDKIAIKSIVFVAADYIVKKIYEI